MAAAGVRSDARRMPENRYPAQYRPIHRRARRPACRLASGHAGFCARLSSFSRRREWAQLPIETFHAKLVVADDTLAYVGSANLLSSSEGLSLETGFLSRVLLRLKLRGLSMAFSGWLIRCDACRNLLLSLAMRWQTSHLKVNANELVSECPTIMAIRTLQARLTLRKLRTGPS